eukprot:TRINITY_DN11534_c0_g2_i3.p1 TRINITY_DN11534_c0_g2~~TRINITY_DN11534_c0_g2_i3.p1  ORF type:complete len:253 (-),score=86.20 TRINITY_DN11534_c0_g2_i3:146-904(-)
MEVLRRLVAARDLQLTTSGSGKKHKCRIELQGEALAKAEEEATAAEAAAAAAAAREGYPKEAEQKATASGSAAANSSLAELHKERQQRQEALERRKAAEAEERRQENERAKGELKVAKKQGKQKAKGTAAAADDDDIDALLEEFTQKDGICAFGTCNAKIHTLMDMLSKCKHCQLRFCTTHAQAEKHGCGDMAQRAAHRQNREVAGSITNPRGGGLANKPCGDARGSVSSKLQDKLKESQAARATKKPEKKK